MKTPSTSFKSPNSLFFHVSRQVQAVTYKTEVRRTVLGWASTTIIVFHRSTYLVQPISHYCFDTNTKLSINFTIMSIQVSAPVLCSLGRCWSTSRDPGWTLTVKIYISTSHFLLHDLSLSLLFCLLVRGLVVCRMETDRKNEEKIYCAQPLQNLP